MNEFNRELGGKSVDESRMSGQEIRRMEATFEQSRRSRRLEDVSSRAVLGQDYTLSNEELGALISADNYYCENADLQREIADIEEAMNELTTAIDDAYSGIPEKEISHLLDSYTPKSRIIAMGRYIHILRCRLSIADAETPSDQSTTDQDG